MTTNTQTYQDVSLSHIWERLNVSWLIAGLFAGLLAGGAMIGVGCVLAQQHLGSWTEAFKLVGNLTFGFQTQNYVPSDILFKQGVALHFGLSALFGICFAQLTNEKSRSLPLLPLSFATSFIIWVFGFNLFTPSVNPTLKLFVPVSTSLLLHGVFALAFWLFLVILRPVFVKK